MKTLLSLINLTFLLCMLSGESKAEYIEPTKKNEPTFWQWITGATPALPVLEDCDECCNHSIQSLLRKILNNLTLCCDELNMKIDEILASFSCNGFTPISSIPPTGYLIATPGKYCVTADLTYSGLGAAITIASDKVFLDFDYHTLTLPSGSTASFGLEIQQNSNIIIRNPVISVQNGSDGIVLLSSENCLIERPIITSSASVPGNIGIFIRGNVTTSSTNVMVITPYVTGFKQCIASIDSDTTLIKGGYVAAISGGFGFLSTGGVNRARITDLIANRGEITAASGGSNFIFDNITCINSGFNFAGVSRISVNNCTISSPGTTVAGINAGSGTSQVSINKCRVSTQNTGGTTNIGIDISGSDCTVTDSIITNNDIGIKVEATAVGTAIIGCTQRNNFKPIIVSNATTIVRDSNSFANNNIPTYLGATLNNADFDN
jgi:hypothetical protein